MIHTSRFLGYKSSYLTMTFNKVLSFLCVVLPMFVKATYWERDGWSKSNETVNLEDSHTVVFGLDFPIDYDVYDAISDPSSPNFRKFLTKDETRQIQTAGLEVCRDAVVNHLAEVAPNLNLAFVTSFEEYVSISGPWISILELFDLDSLLVERFHRLEEELRRPIVRAIPVAPDIDIVDLLSNTTLRECIGGIYRLSDFPPWSRPTISPGDRYEDADSDGRKLKECKNQKPKSNLISPQVLFDMYSVPSIPADNLPSDTSNIQVIYEGTSERVSQNDLACFTNSFNLNTDPSLTGNYEDYNTNNCGNACGEPNLDAQYLVAMNQGVDVNYQAYDAMDTLFTNMKDMDDDELPTVVSISYGISE